VSCSFEEKKGKKKVLVSIQVKGRDRSGVCVRTFWRLGDVVDGLLDSGDVVCLLIRDLLRNCIIEDNVISDSYIEGATA
jgi:hypothetical protein